MRPWPGGGGAWQLASLCWWLMLAALTAATVWYIQGAHTPNDAIDSVRRVLLRIKAYFSG